MVGVQSIVALLIVFGVLAALVWLVRRGPLGARNARLRAALVVEGAVPLGERRSLVVVSVEGRRLLLGLTPAQVSLVTELAPAASFGATLDARIEAERGRS